MCIIILSTTKKSALSHFNLSEKNKERYIPVDHGNVGCGGGAAALPAPNMPILKKQRTNQTQIEN